MSRVTHFGPESQALTLAQIAALGLENATRAPALRPGNGADNHRRG